MYAGNAAKYGKGSKNGQVKVTEKDLKTGEKKNILLPPYGEAECEKLLKPVLVAVKERLDSAGLGHTMMWGKGSDHYPRYEHISMLERIVPGTPWYRESHWDCGSLRYDPKDKKKAVRVGSSSIVWGGAVPDPSKGGKRARFYGWKYNPKHFV